MQIPDRVTGLFLVGLGGVAAWAGSRLPPVPGQDVGPNVFPMVIGAGLIICGVMIALRIGQHFEAEAEADLAAHSDQPPPEAQRRDRRFDFMRVLLPPALLFFYFFAVERLGFLPTAVTIVFAMSVTLGASLRLAIPLAIAAPIAIHLIFSKLLRVPLPDGILPLPW